MSLLETCPYIYFLVCGLVSDPRMSFATVYKFPINGYPQELDPRLIYHLLLGPE